MPINIVNWAFAKTKLERDLPDADPAEINRISILAGVISGAAGLAVPFIYENNLPKDETSTTTATATTATTATTAAMGGTNERDVAQDKRIDEQAALIAAQATQLAEQKKRIDDLDAALKQLKEKGGRPA